MELFVIYIILSSCCIAGTDLWDDFPTIWTVILCIVLGWFLLPCLVMFAFGKLINYIIHNC